MTGLSSIARWALLALSIATVGASCSAAAGTSGSAGAPARKVLTTRLPSAEEALSG